MQADNQPHNLLFTPRYIYVFPKPLARPARSFELYPETVGGPELIGSFTVYTRGVYDGLFAEHADELVRINTAPLPSRLLPVRCRRHYSTRAPATCATRRRWRPSCAGSRKTLPRSMR